MFTLKLYEYSKIADSSQTVTPFRQRIVEVVSLTVYVYSNEARQITAHMRDDEDRVFYVGAPPLGEGPSGAPIYDKAIIENSAGRTTEVIYAAPAR